MDRYIRWLEDSEISHAERALKFAKFPNSEKKVLEHQIRADAMKHALEAAFNIRCEHAAPKRLSVVPRKQPWYQRLAQLFL